MKKLLLLIALTASISIFAQSPLEKVTDALQMKLETVPNNSQVLVWVFFKDKGPDINAYYNSPKEVVSQRSLNRRAKYLPQNHLLKYTDLPVYKDYIKETIAKGFKLKHVSRWFNGISGWINKSQITELADMNSVKKVDMVYKLKKDYTFQRENDNKQLPPGTKRTQLNKTDYNYNYGSSLTQMQQINVPALHDLGYHAQGITICSMDAGFNNLAHVCFDSMNIIATWDFVNNDPNVGDQGDMGNGSHGTETLSTIGGFDNGELIGPAFGANFILTKTENTDSETPIEEDNWIAAMEWADSIGVDVTTTSLDYLVYDPPYPSYTWMDMDGNTARITIAADLAAGLGIVVVNSAGNDGYNSSHNTLGAPADGDSVITIGAVSSDGSRAGFSSVGPTVDGRIKPDVMAMGDFDYVASPYSSTGFTYSSGTSFSCPLAAGVAALILNVNPSLTPMQVREAMRNTASNASNPNNLMGWGILNAYDAAYYYPLPVELTSFSANYLDNKVELNWQTATETNNYGFEIQRKFENSGYKTVGFVQGNGTSTNSHEYSYTDKNISIGTYYYRLKQVDVNGNVELSKEIKVEVQAPENFHLYQNYPNPFNPSTTIQFSVPHPSKVKITLFNILGSKVKTLLDGEVSAGLNNIVLNANNLSSGVYFVQLRAESYQQVIKITLTK